MKVKISYLVSHPIQYFSPLFRALAIDHTIELKVYYCANPDKSIYLDKGFGKIVTWDIPLLQGYAYEFLNNLASGNTLDNKFWSLINPDIVKKLYRDKSDVVIIHGWSYFTNCLTVITAWLLGKQVWLRGENPFRQEIIKPAWLRAVKKILLQFGLFKIVDRFLYIGTENKKFYMYYGVHEDKLIHAPYCVNNDFFADQAQALGKNREAARASMGLTNDSVVILFSGKYINKKRPVDLLKAYRKVKSKNVQLIMVGEGELRQDIEDFMEKNQLEGVTLTGFINQSEISKYYSVADIFVLPSGSGETWGLVVNEAMLFSLPVIVSDTVGSGPDLVKHGKNGFIFRQGDIEQLAEYLEVLIRDKKLRMNAGAISRAIVDNFNYSIMIENMKKYTKIAE